MYITQICPIIIYGSETWALAKKDRELGLEIFKRKVLRVMAHILIYKLVEKPIPKAMYN